ncbi:alpha amylase family protein [Paenibacillus alkalitolerans]|uniref:alpha amylase family protein n=1 Tax=Paenibacillus alkalitolerans TaxID=2799335 RepID=UPI0018F29BBF|nr:alpha amylase family protein [Paenibacillus alkalitolerans]
MKQRCKAIIVSFILVSMLVLPFYTAAAKAPHAAELLEEDHLLENFYNSQGIEIKGLNGQSPSERYNGKAIQDNGLKGNILWFDLSANLSRLNSRESVQTILDKTKKANIDTIVVDVKNYTGFVAYQSEIAPHISSSTIPPYQNYYDENYDLLSVVIEEAKARNLKVHAAVNVFSEGSNTYKDGPAFRNPDWQTRYYYAVQVVTAPDGSQYDLFGQNKVRAANTIVKYTSDYNVTPRVNRWGAEAVVIDNKVVQIIDGVTTGEVAAVPEDGYVLSGHGEGRTWILQHLHIGDAVDLSRSRTDIIPAAQYPTFATFVNPIYEEVRQYELNIVKEIVSKYDVDGVVLDRARYSNVYADFSDLSRSEFEKYIGAQVENWPEDIFQVKFTETGDELVAGPWFKKWIEWRAHNIYNFFNDARDLVKSVKDDVYFSTYVGSWYPYYYNEGVNWGSKRYIPDEPWASEDYHKYGYAGLLDFIMTGLYYPEITEEEAVAKSNPEWMSVEGAAHLSTEVVDQDTFVYGSLYLLQYQGQPERFKQAVEMTVNETNGIMIFDLVYLEMYDWWHILENTLNKSNPPHENPGLSKLIE